jgi:PIN domain nuclease of toxin-antitoxin system
LDSSTLIWATSARQFLSAAATTALESGDEIYVSAASAWEVATKHRSGRLEHAGPLVHDWLGHLDRFGYRHLDIAQRHALRAGGYDVAHSDPFDRIIAAQAELEGMAVVASNRAFDLIPVTRTW